MQAAATNGVGVHGQHDPVRESREGEQALVASVMTLREEAIRARKADAQDDKGAVWELAYWVDQWAAVLLNYNSPIVITAFKDCLLHQRSALIDACPTNCLRNRNRRSQRDVKVEQVIDAVWYRHRVALNILDAL